MDRRDDIEPRLATALASALPASGPVVVLTGAGISAESGIPTFRGPEGYWQIGSRNYHPQELATRAGFAQMPAEIWGWYLYRRSVCRAAQLNAAHTALVELERRLVNGHGKGFVLITQNVDGLHLRAGNAPDQTLQIHGNIDFVRCLAECSPALRPIPLETTWAKGRMPTDTELAALACPRCGRPGRPHVLWFDEYYDEPLFRYETAMRAAYTAALLVIVGTSGGTNLPMQIAHTAAQRGTPLITIGPQPTPFSALAENGPGVALLGTARQHVPELVARLIEALDRG